MIDYKPDATKNEVENFYDKYTKSQTKIGVNIRHRTIVKHLKKLNLKANSKVLEIGCGIGTVSSLILKHIPNGKFVGVDISKESIELAKKYNSAHKNAEFIANDMSDFTHTIKFDFIVFPDVLEHIPVEQHYNLFKNVAKVCNKNTTVLINIPEPNCLNWIRKTMPDKLQIIDQSLSMQDLLNNTYPHGFKLSSMQNYSLYYEENDFTSIVLKTDMSHDNYTLKSTLQRGTENFFSKL
jgi:cyclopropane fatty-acyl-phospholipid synthase-like methyltransferase